MKAIPGNLHQIQIIKGKAVTKVPLSNPEHATHNQNDRLYMFSKNAVTLKGEIWVSATLLPRV